MVDAKRLLTKFMLNKANSSCNANSRLNGNMLDNCGLVALDPSAQCSIYGGEWMFIGERFGKIYFQCRSKDGMMMPETLYAIEFRRVTRHVYLGETAQAQYGSPQSVIFANTCDAIMEKLELADKKLDSLLDQHRPNAARFIEETNFRTKGNGKLTDGEYNNEGKKLEDCMPELLNASRKINYLEDRWKEYNDKLLNVLASNYLTSDLKSSTQLPSAQQQRYESQAATGQSMPNQLNNFPPFFTNNRNMQGFQKKLSPTKRITGIKTTKAPFLEDSGNLLTILSDEDQKTFFGETLIQSKNIPTVQRWEKKQKRKIQLNANFIEVIDNNKSLILLSEGEKDSFFSTSEGRAGARLAEKKSTQKDPASLLPQTAGWKILPSPDQSMDSPIRFNKNKGRKKTIISEAIDRGGEPEKPAMDASKRLWLPDNVSTSKSQLPIINAEIIKVKGAIKAVQGDQDPSFPKQRQELYNKLFRLENELQKTKKIISAGQKSVSMK